ncbi:MAG: Bax inhibitor-1/YccA family protein [Nanoarchaeota archaeon]|nr:Bax inhibitor-1/YccA family protein [Nanoarchaeota archaeon]
MEVKAKTKNFFNRVYFWMVAGLVLSAVFAFLVSSSQTLMSLVLSPLIFVFIIAELVMVIVLSARFQKLKTSTAKTLFIIYSILNGITLSVILLAYTGSSIFLVFLIAAVMFGSLGFVGFVTKKDLSAMGKFLFMALIGLILAMIINMFWKNSGFDLLIAIIGVLIFAGLTAYDHQWLKKISLSLKEKQVEKFAIFGALKLYLDFINMFLLLLRLFGRRR